jgi:hypothetical protein
MDISKLDTKALLAHYRHLEKMDAVLRDEKRTPIGRRLAIERYRGDLVALGASSLEEASNLKRVLGIALVATALAILTKVFGSLGSSTPSDTGSKIAATQEQNTLALASLASALHGVSEAESLPFLVEHVFKDDPKAKEKGKQALDAILHSPDPILLALLLGDEHRGFSNREIFTKYDVLSKHTGKMFELIKFITDAMDAVTASSAMLMAAIATDRSTPVNAAENPDVKKIIESIDELTKRVHGILGDHITGEASNAEAALNDSLAALNDLLKPNAELDATTSATNLKKLVESSMFVADSDKFLAEFTKFTQDKDKFIKTANVSRDNAEEKANDLSDGDFGKDALKKIAGLCRATARIVNILSNTDKMFASILKGSKGTTTMLKGMTEYISKKGKDSSGNKLSTDVVTESYRDDVIAIEALVELLPKRGFSIESIAAPEQKTLGFFDFNDKITSVSDILTGDNVEIGWSTESLYEVKAYCQMTGIAARSPFSDTFMSRGLAVEDLSMAKKIGAVLALIASFGGLYALWKHFKGGTTDDVSATSEVAATLETASESATAVVEQATDIAKQIEHMSFTGEDAEKNRKAVVEIGNALRHLGIQADANEPKKIADILSSMGKGKGLDAVYAKLAENDDLGILGSEIMVNGPFGKGATSTNFKEFFTKALFIPAYLKALSKNSLKFAEVHDEIVTKLSEESISKTDVQDALASFEKLKAELTDEAFTASLVDFEKYAGVTTENMQVNNQMRELLDTIRKQFDPAKEPKNIETGVKAFAFNNNELAAFQTAFNDLYDKRMSNDGMCLEAIDSRIKHFSSDRFKSHVTKANENLAKLEGLDAKEKDVINHISSTMNNMFAASRNASGIFVGINRSIQGYVRRIKHLDKGLAALTKAFVHVSGGSASTESFNTAIGSLRLPPGLTLEVFDDKSYMEFTDDEFTEDQETLEGQAELLLGDAIAVETWVDDIRRKRVIRRDDVVDVERVCPGLITSSRPLGTFTSFESGTNYQFSLEEAGKLAKGMKIAAVIALAALAVRSAMWLKKKYEMSTNNLAALSHLKEDLDKKTKNADAKAVQLRQLCDAEGTKRQELDLGDGMKFNTAAGESEIKRLRDDCVSKAFAAKNWNKLMEQVIDPSSDIFKVYVPLRVFVHQNLDPMVKTIEQINSQMAGGTGGVTEIKATEWKGINDLERVLGSGITGIEACATQIETMVGSLSGDGATPKQDAKDLTFDAMMDKRKGVDAQVDGNDMQVEKTLEKFIGVAQKLEQTATRKGGSGQDNGAVQSAKAADVNLKQLKLAVAQFAGLSQVYLNFYQALDQAVGFFDGYVSSAIKKAKGDK